MKLTRTAITKYRMPADKAEHIEWDEAMPGFGLRCRAGGKREHRTYVVQYKIGTKHRRITLGNAAKINADVARDKAKQIFGKLVDGTDPANERAKARSEAANTYDALVPDFLAAQASVLKPSYYEATKRYLEQHWRTLNGLNVAAIGRAVVAAQLRVIAKDHGPIAADRARASLSRFYAWCIGEGVAENNPVVGTNKAAEEYKPRDRVLTDDELVRIWNAATGNGFGAIVRLLMLTACRRDEIGSLRWSEIHALDRAGESEIRLPEARTKNGREHLVPLSETAAGLLRGIPAIRDRDHVFGEGKGGFSGWSKAKAALDKASGVSGWTLHDLRRTASTRMADNGVLPHIIEAVINHVSGHKAGVAGIYNRSTYAPEKRQALEVLSSFITTAVAKASGANVTRLKRARDA